jgi:putative MATE family efflux protein
MNNTKLTQGPIRATLIKFSLPVILSMLAAQLYTVVDTMIVGLLLDANALAAVSNSSTILMVFLFLSGGMELGGGLLTAAEKPVATPERLSRLIYNLLFLDLMMGIAMLVLGILTFSGLLRLIQTPEEILSQALRYGVIYLLGLPFQMIYDLSKQILVGVGNSKTPMYLVLLTSGFNIVLDLILVPLMGVAGAALASALAQVLGCVLILIHLHKHTLTVRFHFSQLQVSYARQILRLAPPNALQQMSGTVISMVKQSLLGMLGTMAIAGFSCASKLSSLLLMPVYGFVQSLVTMIAQNTALGQEERNRQAIREAYRILLIYTTLIVLVCIFLHAPLLRLFTSDAEALRYGAILLIWEPISYYFTVSRHIEEAKLRGRQKMLRYLISNVSTIEVNIICSIMLVGKLGYSGFFISTYISATIGLGLAVVMVRTAHLEEQG